LDWPHVFLISLNYSGPIPGAMVQQTNFLGTQPNFVGYQAVEGNSFSGDCLLHETFARHNAPIICLETIASRPLDE
jgi:hypothetical protein